jgi:hypothetical protein
MEQRDDFVKFSQSCDALVLFDSCIQALGSCSSMWTNRRHRVDYGLTGFRAQWLCVPWHDILSKT